MVPVCSVIVLAAEAAEVPPALAWSPIAAAEAKPREPLSMRVAPV